MRSSALTDGRKLADGAGLAASVACAIHCAAMPLVIGYLPMLGLSWLADESFHQVMACVCFLLALAAFLPGWRRHRSFVPAGVGLAGISLLTGAAFGLEGECCSACAASSEPLPQKSVCTDECCSGRPVITPDTSYETSPAIHTSLAIHEAPAETPPAGGFPASLIPWITPLGGVLLVAGHLANHQKSCRGSGDRCCLPPGNGSDN